MALTLSVIRNYDSADLTAPSNWLTARAGVWDHVFTTAHSQVDGSTWQGDAATLVRANYAGDLAEATTLGVQPATLMAQSMTTFAEAMGNAKNEVLGIVNNAQQEGFEADEDFQLHDVGSKTEMEQHVRQPILAAHQSALTGAVQAFQVQDQAAAEAIQGHATELGAFQLPDRHLGPFCGREQEPGACTNETDNQGHATGGTTLWPTTLPDGSPAPGSFDPRITIDRSTVKPDETPPWAITDLPPVKPDWPTAPSSFVTPTPTPSPFGGLSPGGLGMPPVPPGAGAQQGIIDGNRNGLPVLAGSSYRPTGGNHIQMVDNTTNPWTDPGGVWAPQTGEMAGPPPVTPLPHTPIPPHMTAMPDDEYMPPPKVPYVPKSIDPGGVMAGASLGCLGGMGGLAGILAITGPGEVAAPIGCALGGVAGAAGGVLAPAFDNTLHGVPVWDAFKWDGD